MCAHYSPQSRKPKTRSSAQSSVVYPGEFHFNFVHVFRGLFYLFSTRPFCVTMDRTAVVQPIGLRLFKWECAVCMNTKCKGKCRQSIFGYFIIATNFAERFLDFQFFLIVSSEVCARKYSVWRKCPPRKYTASLATQRMISAFTR